MRLASAETGYLSQTASVHMSLLRGINSLYSHHSSLEYGSACQQSTSLTNRLECTVDIVDSNRHTKTSTWYDGQRYAVPGNQAHDESDHPDQSQRKGRRADAFHHQRVPFGIHGVTSRGLGGTRRSSGASTTGACGIVGAEDDDTLTPTS